MGLDVYVEHPDLTGEQPSERYPEHLFKKNYLRSSYNGGGFNSVVSKLVGHELYWVFGLEGGHPEGMEGWVEYDEATDEGGVWIPTAEHLTKCRARAEVLANELAAIERPLRTFEVNLYPGAKPLDGAGAIAHVLEEEARWQARVAEAAAEGKGSWGGAYSGAQGHFFLDQPVKMLAAVVGVGALGDQVVHVVYEDQDFDWYRQGAAITVELIDAMLAHPGAGLVWSA